MIFNSRELAKGQTGKVLSEGEKSIVAFAYYLGDAHIKVNSEEDYKRLFFIIDDSISSMDFSYVYSLSGVIRKFKISFLRLAVDIVTSYLLTIMIL